MINIKVNVEARQTLIDRSYFLMEKLQVVMADYTIDYEEYYNRKIVGCDTAGVWGTGGDNGYCDLFTYYGNGENNLTSALTYCSSTDDLGSDVISMTDCLGDRAGDPQPYGSYAATFIDMRNNVDTIPSVVNDEDDVDLGMGPVAIAGSVPELYLISYNGTKRLFLRRALVGSGDWNGDGLIDPSEKFYSVQQLQLQGVDAGYAHNFDGEGAFDGVVDTRWCDAELGYECLGDYTPANAIATAYRDAGYRYAENPNQGWVDIFGRDITVSDWSLELAPTSDYQLAWADDNTQVSPFVTINFTTQLYAENWARIIGDIQVENFVLPLQTTFSMKQFYR